MAHSQADQPVHLTHSLQGINTLQIIGWQRDRVSVEEIIDDNEVEIIAPRRHPSEIWKISRQHKVLTLHTSLIAFREPIEVDPDSRLIIRLPLGYMQHIAVVYP